jgi:hypothetical protein
MAVEYNELKLRKKLLIVYALFVEDPSNFENLEKIKELDGKYSSLAAANDYIASQPIPKEIQEGVGFLHKTWAYSYGATREELVKEAKKILENLRKS